MIQELKDFIKKKRLLEERNCKNCEYHLIINQLSHFVICQHQKNLHYQHVLSEFHECESFSICLSIFNELIKDCNNEFAHLKRVTQEEDKEHYYSIS